VDFKFSVWVNSHGQVRLLYASARRKGHKKNLRPYILLEMWNIRLIVKITTSIIIVVPTDTSNPEVTFPFGLMI